MTTVYVPNAPLRKDPATGAWVSSMSLHAAEKHGTLFYIFSQEEAQAGAAPCEAIVDRRMAGITAEDCVLFVGDPSLMAIVIRAQARLLPGVRLNLLKWDRWTRDYIKVTLK
jgi:hypothetical protein